MSQLSDYIASDIRRLRLSKGIGQRELARQVGVSFVHLNRIEKGHTDLSMEMADRIAGALGEEIVVYMTGTDFDDTP